MKKLFWGIMVLLTIASVFFSVLPVYADDGDNLKRAGQQALQEREEVLIAKKAEIDSYIQRVAADRIITKDETVALWDKVDYFSCIKREADNYLVVYKLKTRTDLDNDIKEAVSIYGTRRTLWKRDLDNKIKVFFASRSGKDVIVEGGMVVRGTEIVFMIIAVCGVFLILWGAIIAKKSEKAPIIILGVIIFIIPSIFLLI